MKNTEIETPEKGRLFMSKETPKVNEVPEASELFLKAKQFYNDLVNEMRKVIVGQRDVLDLIIVAMLCKGHVLLEGGPGLGKTLMFRTLSKILNLEFRHVQFTPDLMPSDIIGTEIIQDNPETRQRELKFFRGPVFCNFLLADEINRTSPKTQSALLQSMQDREVSVGTHTYALDAPFFVLATQNPIDQEGTYPLPEAQLDRFMLNIYIDYPAHEEEVEIVQRFTHYDTAQVNKMISRQDITMLQAMVKGMLISDSLVRYVVDIVTATRPHPNSAYPFVKEWVEWGASPRASLALVMASKARALLKGRLCVSAEDVRAIAPSVLRHRIKVNFSGEAENVTSLDIIKKLVEAVPERK